MIQREIELVTTGCLTFQQEPAPSSGGVKRKRSFIFSKRLPFFKKQEKENKNKEGGMFVHIAQAGRVRVVVYVYL